VVCCNCWGGFFRTLFLFIKNSCKDARNLLEFAYPIDESRVMYMESTILLSQGQLSVPCKISEPDDGDIRRIVLGVHGFGGSSEDEIQVGIAEEMALFRSVTIRFDFPNHGENPTGGDFTLENCMESLLSVAEHARKRYADVEDLCIFASGFGAYVTLLCLRDLLEMPGKVKLVVQTPSLRMDNTLLAMTGLTRETLRALDRYTTPWPRPLVITYRFYQELHSHNALETYPIPMLILHGEEDAFIPMTDIQNFHRINERSQLAIIPGTSHRFLEEGAWDMVLDLTRDWFEFEQVLLL